MNSYKQKLFLFSLILAVVFFFSVILIDNSLLQNDLFAKKKASKSSEIIIDNSSDKGFKTKGDWESDGGEGGENYGDDSLWAYDNKDATDEAIWTPKLPKDGQYKVYVWYCGDPNGDHAEKAPYYVHTGKNKKKVIVNLTEKEGKWNLLGKFKMKKKEKNYVRATSCEDGNVIADAVKFVYVGKK